MEIYKLPIYIRRNGHWDFLKFIYVEAENVSSAFTMASRHAKALQSDNILAIEADEIDVIELTQIT